MQSDETTIDDIAKVRDAIRGEPMHLEQIRKASGLGEVRLSAALDALEHAGGVKVIYDRNPRGKIFCTRYQLVAMEVTA